MTGAQSHKVGEVGGPEDGMHARLQGCRMKEMQAAGFNGEESSCQPAPYLLYALCSRPQCRSVMSWPQIVSILYTWGWIG